MRIEYTRVVDLSLKLHNHTPVYPGDPPVAIKPVFSMPDDRVNVLGIQMATHQGTHMDAPYHQVAGGKFLDDFAPDMFINRALKIDVVPRQQGSNTNTKEGVLYRQVVTAHELAPYEQRIGEVEAVVIHTGYGPVVERGRLDKDFPILDPSAAELLAACKNLNVAGIDSVTVDAFGENKIHHILLARGDLLILETLVRLEQLPATFTLCCLPLAIQNADGAPCRALALC